MWHRKYYALLFVLTLTSCMQSRPSSKSFPIKPLIIFGSNDDGWGGDIRISITDITENDTSKIYKALSIYNNKYVGLLVCIPKKRENNMGFGKNIIFKSIGKASNELLSVMSELYNQPISKTTEFATCISADYINLDIFAKSVTGINTKDHILTQSNYKLFFTSKNDEAELFLNINEKEHWIELKEKDLEYRALVIESFKK